MFSHKDESKLFFFRLHLKTDKHGYKTDDTTFIEYICALLIWWKGIVWFQSMYNIGIYLLNSCLMIRAQNSTTDKPTKVTFYWYEIKPVIVLTI